MTFKSIFDFYKQIMRILLGLEFQEMRNQGFEEDRLQLLHGVSGAFRPGILTALVGVSGAGKTTLMDVLAGRKTGGYIEGDISISGYPKNQETFARVSGYCEQNDIHSPHVTVYESLLYSAWLRLSSDIDTKKRKVLIYSSTYDNSFQCTLNCYLMILLSFLIFSLLCPADVCR